MRYYVVELLARVLPFRRQQSVFGILTITPEKASFLLYEFENRLGYR